MMCSVVKAPLALVCCIAYISPIYTPPGLIPVRGNR